MQLTKGAIGNLINRYKAVLKKCHLMNTFGSLAVAGMLVMGGAGVAVAEAVAEAAKDVALGSGDKYTPGQGADHLMGGWLVKDAATAGDAKGDITLTVNGGKISEIIGGSYAKNVNGNNVTVTHGDITTTIGGETTSAEFVVGGSKVAGGAGAKLETGKISLTINGGKFGDGDPTKTEENATNTKKNATADKSNYELVMGGNYLKASAGDGSVKNTAAAKNITVNISGGDFKTSVTGGSVAHVYGTGATPELSVTDASTSVTITGGTFGQSYSTGLGAIELDPSIIGGGLALVANNQGKAFSTITGNTLVTINGDMTIDDKVLGGSLAQGQGATVTIGTKGGTSTSAVVVENVSKVGDLVGGNMAEGGTATLYGDSYVKVEAGKVEGDVIGGSYARGAGSVTTTGKTGVVFNANNNATVPQAEYIVGGDKVLGNGTATGEIKGTSSVTVDNKASVTTGAVVGGSFSRATPDTPTATATATATVTNSEVTINGGKSIAGVVGGGLAENLTGTKAASDVTKTSTVSIKGGTVTNIVYTYYTQSSGTQKASSSAAVAGAGFATGNNATASVKDSVVVIDGADTVIKGNKPKDSNKPEGGNKPKGGEKDYFDKDSAKVVAGGVAVNGGTVKVTNTSLTMKNGTVTGDLVGGNLLEKDAKDGGSIASTKVNVEGGTVAGKIYGGSYVCSTTATSKVDNTTVNISGGTINGNVFAGGLADGTGAKAEVTKANLTISGNAVIDGNIHAGGYALNGGTATVENATVTFDGNSSFAKKVFGQGHAEKSSKATVKESTLAFTNYTDEFKALVVGFDNLNVAEGSTLKLGTLSTRKASESDKAGVFNNKALTLAGAGNVEAAVVDVMTGTSLSVKDGTLNVTKSLKSAAIGAEAGAGNAATGIIVSGNGVLRADNKLLVQETKEGISIAKDLKALYLGQGGTLAVTGLGSISMAAMKDYHDALVAGGTGLIKYEGAAIEISTDDKTPSGNLQGDKAEATGALLTGTTVEYTTTTTGGTTETEIKGGYGADTVLISNAANDNHTVNLTTGDLTLLGDGKNLITVKGEGTPTLSKVTVNADMALNLGSAAAPSQGGNLGANVELVGTGSSLNAVAGDYTVGDVTGGTGAVTANTGANLNTGKIDVNAVTADAANIKATGDVTATTITLVKGGSVTSGESITVDNSIENADGTLQAGGDITAKDPSSTASDKNLTQANNGKLTVVAGGTITANNITATNVAAKKLTASGDVAVDGGTLKLTGTGTDVSTVDSLKLTNGTQADIKGSLKLDGTGKTLTVGTGDDTVGGTTLSAQHIDLDGGTLLVDPAWNKASSNVAVASMGTPTTPSTTHADVIVDGDVGVGQNSYLALGTDNIGWLRGVVGNYTKGVGLSETGITAALGVFTGIEIGAGKALLVNVGLMDTAETGNALTNAVNTAADNSATFGANSLLVVNGADAGIAAGGAAITFGNTAAGTNNTLTVSEGAKLLVTDAVAGQTYTIVGNVATSTVDGWKNNGMTSTTDMISLGDAVFTLDTGATTGKVTTSATRNDAHTVFPNLSDGMANAVNDLYTGHAGAAGQPNWDYADVNSADMGVRFLSRATDNRFLGMDKEAAAATIESAARIAFAGAVPQMTKMASDAGTNAVVNRLGFADPADGAQAMDADGKIVDRNTTGFALWIAPLWQSQHGWGMDADSMDYGFNGNLGGVSLGADYTFENAIRAGITFNIGGGYAESSGGDLSSTDNRMNFWGLGAYAGWNYENFGVMADVSYTSTWNQLKQDVDSRMGMGDLEADVQATAISAGLRAEYLLQTSAMDIIPHIGVRYMSLNTWGYDVDTHGGTVLEGDSLHQDIWTFPIGVTFSKDFTLDSGWSFKPSLDFTVIPAAGDIKAKHDVHFTGLPGTYEVETQMMDYLTWQGGVGLELANDNMSIGVNYTLQAGQHTTGHGVFGSFRYEF